MLTATLFQVLNTDDTQSFSFLSERHIILADLYVSSDLEDIEPYLTIIDFRAEDERMKTLREVQHFIRLCYPHTVRDATVTSFNIHCEPSPCWTVGTHDSRPFFLAPENRVILASMQVMKEHIFPLVHAIPFAALNKWLGCIGTSRINVCPGQNGPHRIRA